MERNERHGNPDLGEVEKIVQAVAHGELDPPPVSSSAASRSGSR